MADGVRCWCQHCSRELEPSHTGECPYCGKSGKRCEATALVGVGVVVSTKVKAKLRKEGNTVKEVTQRGHKKSHDTKSEHGAVDEISVVDREVFPPMWHQVVKDSRTGEVTHDEHVPLDQKRRNNRGNLAQSVSK